MLLFLQKERSLGGIVDITGNQRDIVKAKLKPTGSISGQLVDSEGEPITSGDVSLMPENLGLQSVLWTASVDGEGRFTIDNLISSVPFSLRARVLGQQMELFVLGNIRTEPGERLELGVFRQKNKNQFIPVEMKATPK